MFTTGSMMFFKPNTTTCRTPEDAMVMSCANFRTSASPSYLFDTEMSSLNNKEMGSHILPLITPEDHIQAAKVRDYFSKKIMMLVLRGVPLSPYRKRLSQFLNLPNPREVGEDMLPIIAKLPVFYAYDQEFDALRQTLTPVPVDRDGQGTLVLKPEKHFSVKLKSGSYEEYWLKDDQNYGHKIKLPTTPVKNPLLHLWTREFAKGQLTIDGLRTATRTDGFSYYLLTNWQLT